MHDAMAFRKIAKGIARGGNQLWLLLWRNTLIRWRGGGLTIRSRTIPVFHVIEILWPLFLYVVLLALRLQFPPEQIQDSVYRANALPSAGVLPFLQSVVCDLSGGRDQNNSDVPLFLDSVVSSLYPVVNEIGSWNSSWNRLCDSIHHLADQSDCVSSAGSLIRSECISVSGTADSVPLTCFLRNESEFQHYLTSDLHLNTSVVDGIIGASVDLSELPSTVPSFARSKRQESSLDLPSLLGGLLGNSAFSSLQGLACNSQLLDRFVTFKNISSAEVTNELCRLSPTQFASLTQHLQDQIFSECSPLEELRRVSDIVSLQQLLAVDLNKTFGGLSELGGWTLEGDNSVNSSIDGQSDDDCLKDIENQVHFFCGSERKKASSIFQQLLGKSCHGNTYQNAERKHNNKSSLAKQAVKIMYTPDTNLTRNIIARASTTFQSVTTIMDWAAVVANCTQFFLDRFPPDSPSVQQAREVVDALVAGNSSSFSALGLLQNPNDSLDSLLQLQQLLNISNPENLWSKMESVHNFSSQVYESLDKFDWDVFLPVQDEQSMEKLAGNYTYQDEEGITYIAAGVVFEDNLPLHSTPNLTKTTVKIRMNFSYVLDTTVYREPIWTPGPENEIWKRKYIQAFFIFIQDMIERALAEELSGNNIASPGVYLQQMPYPCYKLDEYTISLEYVLPLAMLFSWLFPIAMTTRALVHEKEVRMKEFMKMMGLSDWVLRMSWFLHSALVLFVTVLFISFILKVGGLLPATHWTLVILYLTLYAVVMLAYSFLMSVFFNNANLAACVTSLIYFLVFFAHVTLVPNMSSLSPVLIGAFCLWAPLGFGLGATYLVQWELRQEGLQWSNISATPVEDDNLSFLIISLILIFDTVLYLVLTWYIEGVHPGRYGVAKPWYFPLMPSYWLGQRRRGTPCCGDGRVRRVTLHEEPADDGEHCKMVPEGACEEEPVGLALGISILNLTKEFRSGFKKKVIAVKDLSLNFYEGQITAFLGHNGAGKTTTMSVLTGLYEPTSGTAHIYGNNIKQHMDIIRQTLGMCPQHNILFDNLTVTEHLMFYGQLKGLTRKEAKAQIPGWLSKVGLSEHSHKVSKHLSGGMKRKLSILLAFVGKCQTIILDEPTSGVDPYARRQIWDFILRHREGRTIMLSTHHMDEAEILGDRIAIISNGALICSGSFEYLKHKFGRGHKLTLVTSTTSERRPSTSSRTFTITADIEETDHAHISPDPQPFDGSGEDRIVAFIQGYVTSASLEEKRGRELHFRLPLHQSRPTVLATLFKQLELQKDMLGVASYGLSSCSMEEIFVELTEQELLNRTEANLADSSAPRPSLVSINSRASLDSTTVSDSDPTPDEDEAVFDEEGLLFGDRSCDDPLGSGDHRPSNQLRLHHCSLWLTQFCALIVKRLHYTKRKLLALIVQNIFPLIVIALSLLIARYLQTIPNHPPLELSPSLFFKDSKYNYMFVGGYYDNMTTGYIDPLFHPCGVGANTLNDPKCYYNNNDNTCPIENYPLNQNVCTCTSCDNLVPFPHDSPYCYNGTQTGTRVQNITLEWNGTGTDPNLAYDTLTTYLLRSKLSFIEKRYGGISFGHQRPDVDPTLDMLNSDGALPFLATHSIAKVWYSLKGYHAMPVYLNVLNNAILRANLNSTLDKTIYGIRTVSHPFNLTELEKEIYAVTEKASFLVNPLAAIFSLGFVVAGFVLILIEERSKNIKHLQLVCGMSKIVYWLSTYVWDLIWYTAFILLMLLLYVAFQDPFFTSSEVIPLFLILLLCYGLAAAPWMYMFTFLFQSPATAYVMLFCLNFFGGFSFLIVDAVIVRLEGLNDSANFLHYTLLWVPFPSYCLARSMMYFSLDKPVARASAVLSFAPLPDQYSALAPFIGSLCAQAVVYTLIVIAIELRPAIKNLINNLYSRKVELPVMEDEDSVVARERRRIARGDASSNILTLDHLSKIYSRGGCSAQHRLAVNQLCLGMHKAECFGLLGVNGAGKTTTFRMLTGDTGITSGDAIIASHKISESLGPVQQSIGYCPQVDALIDALTGRQHLTLFCHLRGIRSPELTKVVQWALLKLGLQEHADKPVGTYSGGNRRKLSTAIALLARPALILLDEPTSGVDPRARRFLWSIIRGVIGAGQSVLLTTHSMAECEALCSRVGIMVNGRFRCLGSPQQLKTAYGEGYRLKVRLTGDTEAVKEFIRQTFDNFTLKEEHFNTLVYQLPASGLLLSSVYESMEQARATLDIKDYSLSQTTLDDVFIHFANEQSEDIGIQLLSNTEPDSSQLVDNGDYHSNLPDIIPASEDQTFTYSRLKQTEVDESIM